MQEPEEMSEALLAIQALKEVDRDELTQKTLMSLSSASQGIEAAQAMEKESREIFCKAVIADLGKIQGRLNTRAVVQAVTKIIKNMTDTMTMQNPDMTVVFFLATLRREVEEKMHNAICSLNLGGLNAFLELYKRIMIFSQHIKRLKEVSDDISNKNFAVLWRANELSSVGVLTSKQPGYFEEWVKQVELFLLKNWVRLSDVIISHPELEPLFLIHAEFRAMLAYVDEVNKSEFFFKYFEYYRNYLGDELNEYDVSPERIIAYLQRLNTILQNISECLKEFNNSYIYRAFKNRVLAHNERFLFNTDDLDKCYTEFVMLDKLISPLSRIDKYGWKWHTEACQQFTEGKPVKTCMETICNGLRLAVEKMGSTTRKANFHQSGVGDELRRMLPYAEKLMASIDNQPSARVNI